MRIYYNKRKYRLKSSSSNPGPPGYADRHGQAITVLYKVMEDDPDDIYRVSFDDGVIMDAYEDEIAPGGKNL